MSFIGRKEGKKERKTSKDVSSKTYSRCLNARMLAGAVFFRVRVVSGRECARRYMRVRVCGKESNLIVVVKIAFQNIYNK